MTIPLKVAIKNGMCATYTYHVDEATIQKVFGPILIDSTAPFDKTKEEVYPHIFAPVIVAQDGKIVLTAKRYSLTPAWSKDIKVKWATYNARMKRENSKTGNEEFIYEVPTWKGAFGRRHCLVPINYFRESCHDGSAKGHIVAFKPKADDVLFAAGIYEDWVDKKTGEVTSTFAIITMDPSAYLLEVGHDRSPAFLAGDDARDWLGSFKTPKEAFAFLEAHGTTPALQHELVRKLKSAN